MDDKTTKNSKVLMNINPGVRETSLIVNKDIKTLDDLRKDFKPVQSSVLSQVRNFLPKMATANEELQKRLEADPGYSADIEQIDDENAPHIEMNLALMEADYSSEDDSMDSDSSSDDENDNLVGTEVNINTMKMPTIRKSNKLGKKLIQAMDEDDLRLNNSHTDEGNNT